MTYLPVKRARALEAYKNNPELTMHDLAERFGVSKQTAQLWVRNQRKDEATKTKTTNPNN